VKRLILLTLAATLLGATPMNAADKNPIVVMDTSMGKIKIELNAEKAPITVKNFLGYVDDKFYDGTIFHRVMPDFMIQGGGFQDKKEKDTKAGIKNEWQNGLSNKRGTVAMARVGGLPDSASAQFYINLVDNTGLDKPSKDDGAAYCVFGKVIEGMDVVDKIAAVKTENKIMTAKGGRQGRFGNVPVEDVTIKSIRRADTK
jgi:cyclophilin family peptidyl-prolyl cis-trans isomerase